MKTISRNKFNDLLYKHETWLANPSTDVSPQIIKNVYVDTFGRGLYESLDLREIVFEGCSIAGITFENTVFRNARFVDCDLTCSEFYNCDLTNVDFSGTNLTSTAFHGSNLMYAKFFRTNCHNADFKEAIGMDAVEINVSTQHYFLHCPESGSFIGWKKARCVTPGDPVVKSCIVKLLIPENALRSSATSNKCRCSKAIVLEAQDMNGTPIENPEIHSIFKSSYYYHVGDTLEVSDFDTNRWNQCAPGIHFFITRREAELFYL